MKKSLVLVASFAVAAALSLQFGLSNAYAANKADCAQVMTELQGGKTVAQVAKDMMISETVSAAAARPPPRRLEAWRPLPLL